jgi:DNA-directed RNA polymerase specialized sigma24 family protein
VQFAFAAFIDKFDSDCDSPPLAWLTLVAKREAWAKGKREHLDRRAGQEAERGEEGPGVVIDTIPSRASGLEQLVEQVDEARELLGRLKPAERRTVSLIADGYSYREVGEVTGLQTSKAGSFLRRKESCAWCEWYTSSGSRATANTFLRR